jgi:hypothetical protein
MSLCLKRAHHVFLEKDDLTSLDDDTVLKILLNENCVTTRHDASLEIMNDVRLIRSYGRLRFLKSMIHDLPYELVSANLNPKKKVAEQTIPCYISDPTRYRVRQFQRILVVFYPRDLNMHLRVLNDWFTGT